MASRKVRTLPADELHQRWHEHIEWIAEEANYMDGHRIRYRLIHKWLLRPRSRAWTNRHLQAYGWISKLWLTEGLMSVRRQLDDQHGSISLKHLLYEIESRPEVPLGAITSEVAADRRALQDACAPALVYAQRQLAHRVPWDDPFVSMSALDKALDSINATVGKYHLAITGKESEALEHEPDPSWLRSFEVAWHVPRKRRLDRRKSVKTKAKTR
jgi:hypothetical protein